MPALDASSDVLGFAMPPCSHIPNLNAIAKVRTLPADFSGWISHNQNMARRGIPKGPVEWYLREWMAACGVKKQSEMMERTGWSKATMSQLFNGVQDYSPRFIREAAAALNIERYELLMPPEEAMALRNLRREALRVVESGRPLQPTGTDGRG